MTGQPAMLPPTTVPPTQEGLGALKAEFGFKAGTGGAHGSRTIMLAELTTLLAAAPADAGKDDYIKLIVDDNCLGKQTSSNRRLTAKHLAELYALDRWVPLFRLLRFFWQVDAQGRPLLAFLCAFARDPLLRLAAGAASEAKVGDVLTTADFVNALNAHAPGRFTPATGRSIAQNIASSWGQAGFFDGTKKKVRKRPIATTANAAYALALGYLCGLHGQILLESLWARLLDVSVSRATALAQEASRQDWLDFRGSGGLVDIGFPQLLTPHEIKGSHGAN